MGSVIRVGVLATAMAWCGGCSIGTLGPGGVGPGAVFTNVTYPNAINPRMEYRFEASVKDVELLGPVAAEGTSHSILGIVSWGDSGFGVLQREARRQGGDGVINMAVDTTFTRFGFLFVSLYSGVTTKLTGVAYRYRR